MNNQFISLTNASLEQLNSLPELSKKTAKRIIEARPFQTIDDVLSIEGISRNNLKTLENAGLLIDPNTSKRQVTISSPEANLPLLNDKIVLSPIDLNNELLECFSLLFSPQATCCDRLKSVLINNLSLERKLAKGGDKDGYETPSNLTFDIDDTVRLQFDIKGCPPFKIRIVLSRIPDKDETDFYSVDERDIGGDEGTDDGALSATDKNDVYRFRRTDYDLKKEAIFIGAPGAPTDYKYSIVIKDDCGRLGFTSSRARFVSF